MDVKKKKTEKNFHSYTISWVGLNESVNFSGPFSSFFFLYHIASMKKTKNKNLKYTWCILYSQLTLIFSRIHFFSRFFLGKMKSSIMLVIQYCRVRQGGGGRNTWLRPGWSWVWWMRMTTTLCSARTSSASHSLRTHREAPSSPPSPPLIRMPWVTSRPLSLIPNMSHNENVISSLIIIDNENHLHNYVSTLIMWRNTKVKWLHD